MLIAIALFAAAQPVPIAVVRGEPIRAGDALFAPEKGLKVEHTATSEFEFSMDDWTVNMQGKPVPAEYLPALSVEGRDSIEMVTRDTYLASADGKPASLRREFVKLTSKKTHDVSVADSQVSSTVRNGTSALAGCVVLFDERASGAERRKLERGECDKALLEPLAIDNDFTAFAPPDAKTASWEVPAKAFNLFDDHLGGIAFTYDKPAEREHNDPAQLANNVEGSWKLERGEAREEGGAHLAVWKVTGKLATHSEIEGELKDVPVATGPTRERSEMTLELTGEIAWDLDHHVMHSVTLSGPATMVSHIRTQEETEPDVPAYAQDMNFHGKMSVTIAATIAH
jgi:hypothetical protein